MIKDDCIIIDLSNKSFNLYNNGLFLDIVNAYLEKNTFLQLDKIIKNNNLGEVLIEVVEDKLDNVLDPIALYYQVENIYDFWRDYKRYVVIDLDKVFYVNETNYINTFRNLNEFVLDLYRKLCSNLLGTNFSILRELPAGANALILYKNNSNAIYKELENVHFIKNVIFKPPFIVYTKANKRSGVFEIINKNPIDGLKAGKNSYCFPILVGGQRIFVCFDEAHLSMGLSLTNLFMHDKDFDNKKPDIIVLFGSNTCDGIYYDKDNDTYIASLIERDEIDYFGYLKKIILTAYNIKMINEGYLPIHGACVSILLKNQQVKNIILIGDSGAGKSETLEALRVIGKNEIVSMTTIFDDMGTLKLLNNDIKAYGTEIGAFLRTDDLENGFGFKVFDRAIYMNPNLSNSRIVIPVALYDSTIKGMNVDMVLYANNFTNSSKKIELFDSLDSAMQVFEKGQRVAKGTTDEMGLVETFFANPFGPVQLKETTQKLMNKYFSLLCNKGIKIGQIYTGLALKDGKDNPALAAKELLNYLESEK